VSRVTLALAVVIAVALSTGIARGEHEIYYRYTLLGYVKDAKGQPVRGFEVKVVRDKTGFSYLGESDANGLYVVVIRLGDESVGESLTVQAGNALTTRVTVQFDPTNHTEERGTRVDVQGSRAVERSAWFASTLALFLGQTRR
jgi:hypothetical protein